MKKLIMALVIICAMIFGIKDGKNFVANFFESNEDTMVVEESYERIIVGFGHPQAEHVIMAHYLRAVAEFEADYPSAVYIAHEGNVHCEIDGCEEHAVFEIDGIETYIHFVKE